MQLLRGEDIGEVSREIWVAPPELERWRRAFLEGGRQGLKKKNRPGGELLRTRAKLGEMTMRVRVEARGRVNPATNRRYPLTMVCETCRVARSSVYALRAQQGGPLNSDRRHPGKRGPKTALSDEERVEEIRTVLKASPFLGEGHRKVKARLAAKGIRVGKNRVLRLMREHGLLAPMPDPDREAGGAVGHGRGVVLTKAEGWSWRWCSNGRRWRGCGGRADSSRPAGRHQA